MSNNGLYPVYHYFVSTLDKEASSTSNSNFNYNLELPRNIQYNYISVVSAKVSKSYYTIDSTNNTFILSDENGSHSVVVPVGFYTASTLGSALTTLFNAFSALQYDVNYVSLTGRYQITSTAGHTAVYSIVSTYALPYLGVNANSSVLSDGSYVWNSTNIISIQKTSSIHIRSNIVDEREQTLLTLYNINSFANLSDITYENDDVIGKRKKIKNLGNNVFSFTIEDDYDRILDLNGGNIALSIVLWV